MKLNQIVIHELIKEQNKTEAKLDLSLDLLDIDEESINLITNLNERYIRLNNTYAVFGDEAGNNFPKDFENYNNSKKSDSFLEFTKQTLGYLKTRIENIQAAKGGYLVFADYFEKQNFFAIFFIRNTTGVLFTKGKRKYEINKQIHIDLEHMAMACRINKDSYKTKEERYISFIKRKNEPTSEYFIKWICAEDRIDNRTDTRHLYQIITNIPKPQKESGELYSKDELLEEVYDYVKSSTSRYVDIKSLSLQFFKDEETILEYADNNNIQINTQFKADSSVLKQFVNVKFKADEIELSFPPRKFNDIISIDPENNDTVIIKSLALAKKINIEMTDNAE